MAITSEDFDALYQVRYPDDKIPWLLPEALPLINAVMGGNTDGRINGRETSFPYFFGAPAGFSQTYANAARQADKAPQALELKVKLSQAYKSLAFLDKSTLMSEGDASYGNLIDEVVEPARMDFMSKSDQLLHGNGSGNIAAFTYASATPTTIVLVTVPTTLTGDTNQAVGTAVPETMFEIGDELVFTSTNPSDGTAPTIAAAGPFVITAVNDDGTLTIDSSPGLTNTNVYGIAISGNTMGFSSALVNPSLIGIGAINPYGGPLVGDNFCGINRRVYGKRLAGTWQDCSGTFSLEGGLKRGATNMRNTGVTPGGAWYGVDPYTFEFLEDKAQTFSRYTNQQLGVFFFDALALNTAMGRVSVVVDPHQSFGYSRLYAPNFAQLMYRNNIPHFATLSNGLDEQWGANYDGREKRLRAYFQLRTRDPRRLGVVKTAVPSPS